MKRYLARRLLQSLLAIAFAMCAIFLIGRVLGDPVDAIVSDFAGAEERERVREELGYNDPVLVQFGRFVTRVITLDFGVSPVTGNDALGTVLTALPNTAMLALAILAVSLPLGFIVGALGAYRPSSVLDRVLNVLSLAGISIVEFWLGLTLILVIAIPVGGIPTGGTGSIAAFILPTATGAFRVVGRVGQFSRSALLEEYGKAYVEVAKAKGISDLRLFAHVTKNASISIITLSGDEVLSLTNGLVVVETVFAWPGVGRLIIRALQRRDLFVLEAAVFVIVLIVMSVNLLIDLLYTILNPKVHYE